MSNFHFDIRSLESWSHVVDDRMQHLVQDSMSARVLRQVTLMKRRAGEEGRWAGEGEGR